MTSRVNSKSGQHALIYLLTYSQYDFSFFLSAEFENVDPRLAASKEIFPHGPNLFAFRVSQVQVKSEVIHTQHCALRGVRRRWSAPLCRSQLVVRVAIQGPGIDGLTLSTTRSVSQHFDPS